MNNPDSHVTRRHFLRNAAAVSALAGLESLVPAYARPGKMARATGGPIELTIDKQSIDIGGRRASAIAVNGTVPGPLVRLREGQDAIIRVTNQLARESASIHWHGLLVPFRMDGLRLWW